MTQPPDNSEQYQQDDLLASPNWADDPLPLGDLEAWLAQQLVGAERLRAALSGMPFYAERAQARKEARGDEMAYWLGLLGSRPGYRVPIPRAASSTASQMLTPPEVERLRQSALELNAYGQMAFQKKT